MDTITVVGSGVMGKGIAYICAVSGYRVYLNDINNNILSKAKDDIFSLLEGSFQKGFLSEEQYKSAKENLFFEADLNVAAKDAHLVIEAVLEKIELKLSLIHI